MSFESDTQPDEAGATAAQPPAIKTRRALSGLKRELTNEELSSTGTQKMLLEELERLSQEVGNLSGYRESFYQADKLVAVLEEKLKRFKSVEIVSGACLAIGAAALGYAPAVWEHQPSGWICLAFGVVLVVGGIYAKVVKL